MPYILICILNIVYQNINFQNKNIHLELDIIIISLYKIYIGFYNLLISNALDIYSPTNMEVCDDKTVRCKGQYGSIVTTN